MHVGGDDDSELARGTGLPPEDRTKIASPAARNRTSIPPPPPSSPTETATGGRRERRPSSSGRPPVPSRPEDERIGAVLGSYRVVEQIGKGGMGYVYRAEHAKLGREVALKILRSDYSKRRDAVMRFFQEAKTVNRIRHRNIVDVTDFVELDDGTTYIIMELLRGQSLGKWARGGFDLPRALAVLIQICDGLAAAHTVGVIHRDLKPDNVIIVPTSDGAELVKLLDFGVAKLVNRDDEDVGLETAAGSVIGTPAYMSPEQAGGMPIDARSDIYSVGAIMYELFCGQPMFRGRSFGEYVRKHLGEMPARPRATSGGAGMDERLEAAILRAIEKEPARRFQSIAELRDVLLHLLGAIETHDRHASASHQLGTGDLVPITSPAPTLRGPVLPAPMLTPLPPGPRYAQPAEDTRMMSTGISSISQFSVPATGVARSTPWWMWFAGGAIAVGLGIGVALIVTTDDDTAKPATPADPKVGLAPPDETRKPRRVVVIEFASEPASAGVYAVGSPTELCKTPCTLDVDLDDGGAADRRDYVIRATGHVEQKVGVAMVGDRVKAPPVTLAAIEAAEPPTILTPDDEPPIRTSKKPRGKPTVKTDKTKIETPPDSGTKTKTKTKIDRTDTIDPFGGK
jgi:serine/threonine protein kinase